MLKQACLVLLLCHEFANLSQIVEDDLPRRIFKSLEKAVDYVHENREDINVDALFGMVFVQVYLKDIKGVHGFLDVKALNHMKKKVSEILKITSFYQRQLDLKHKIFLRYVLDPNLWQKNISFSFGNFNKILNMFARKLNVTTCRQFRKYIKDDFFSEEISDQCLVHLIKSSVVTPHECRIGDLCTDYMMGNNHYIPAYGTTHRLLFLQVAEARKCSWNKTWMEKSIREYCSYIYWEAHTNSECGLISELDDLFLEQILLCGYEGFIEFLPRKWMEYVLRIQTKYGCFGLFNPPSSNNEGELRKRRKRESNIIKYGCLDHTTGLGAAVLSLSLRYLVET